VEGSQADSNRYETGPPLLGGGTLEEHPIGS
jgi:hypothetical protein